MSAVNIFPGKNIADAAIDAYKRGNRLTTTAKVKVVETPGRDTLQYAKALKIKALQRLALQLR
jgi:hypothetical protein